MNEVSLSDIADHSCISPVHQSYSLRKSSQDLSSQISQSPASFLSFPGTKHTRPAVQAWSSASRTSEHWSSHCCQGTWSLATKSTVCTSEIFWAWKQSLNGRQWWPLSHFVTAFNTSSFSAWLSGSESSLGLWHSSYPMVQSISRVLQKWSSSGSSDNVAKVARSRSVEHLSFHLLSPLAQMSFILFHTICVWVLFFILCLSFVFLMFSLFKRFCKYVQIQQLAAWDWLLSPRILKLLCYMLGTIKLVASKGAECLCRMVGVHRRYMEIPIIDAVTARETWETLTTDHSEIAGSLKYDLWMNQVGKTWSIPSPVDQTIRSAGSKSWYHRSIMIYPLASNSSVSVCDAGRDRPRNRNCEV